jgi:DNA-binding transcriptional LysR family regulator
MPFGPRLPSGPRSGPSVEHSSNSSRADYRAVGPAPIVELKEMHAALAVADELHFTRAAEKVNVTQSALSRQIQQLESALGVQLFQRGTRRVELTDAGEAFVRHARKTLELARAAILRTQAIGKGEPQEFLITYSPFVDTHLVTSMQMIVESAQPRIPVRYRSVAPQEQMQMLLSGRSQIAAVILPLDLEDFESTCIVREPLMVALPRGHSLARRRQLHAAELTGERVIWLARDLVPDFFDHMADLLQRAGYVLEVYDEVQSIPEALGFVQQGNGITFMKRSDARLQMTGIAVRAFSDPFLAVETGLVYPRDIHSEFQQELIELLTNHFRCAGDSSLFSGS